LNDALAAARDNQAQIDALWDFDDPGTSVSRQERATHMWRRRSVSASPP
jgi:hypothetical protein